MHFVLLKNLTIGGIWDFLFTYFSRIFWKIFVFHHKETIKFTVTKVIKLNFKNCMRVF